jgi:hypothetical protein
MICAVGLAILIQLNVNGCGQSPSISLPIPSPDGRLLLKSGVNHDPKDPARYLRVIVEIKDLYGKTIFREITPASDTMRWSIQWIGNDKVLLDSSDIGKYVIRRIDNSRWISGFENSQIQSSIENLQLFRKQLRPAADEVLRLRYKV